MPSQLNQNQVLNYIAGLPLLLGQARTFLDLKNRQGKEIDFKEIDLLLRVYALNLTLISLEEFGGLSFEKVFERLEWLFEQEKLISGGRIPANLEELGAQLEEKKEKTAKETKQRERLAREEEELAANLKKRAELLAALKKVQIETKTEAGPDWKVIIESLPENEELANYIQKTTANPKLSVQEKEAACQEAWERFLDQQATTNAFAIAKQQPLSLETLGQVAEQLKQPPGQRAALANALKAISEPLTEEQRVEVQEDMTSQLVAYAPLAKRFGWETLVKMVARETHKEFPEISQEQISRVIPKELASVAEEVWPAKLIPENDSVLLPPVIMVGQKLKPMVGSPENKGNPWEINQCKEPLFYYWTTRGVSGLEELVKIQWLVSGDPSSPTSQSLAKLADGLKKFQTTYSSLETSSWQTMRAREFYSILKATGLTQRITLRMEVWLAKTGIGQTIELLQQKAAQKGLENLWAIVSQTSLKAATTSAVRGLLLKLGLQVAGTVVPVIGNIAAAIISFVGPALIKRAGRRIERLTQFITSGFGLLDGILQTVSRGGFEDNLKWLTPLFIGLFVVLFFFGNKTIAFDIGSAFLGSSQGEGPWTNPELPYYPSDLQCPNPRHLSEKVACVLEGCQQTTVSFVSWNLVTDCIHDSGLPKEHQTPILEDFKNSLFVTDKNGVPIGFLQCVGFVTGIQHALTGNVIDQRNACGYCHDNTPAGYQRFPGENFDDPEEGDIAVWDGTSCGIVGSGYDYGHVAIVVQKHEDKTMTIAQANYHAPGLVDVSKNVRYGTPNEDGSASPNCFLRYTGH